MTPTPPTVYAFVPCGVAYRDGSSGAFSLLGTFDTVYAPAFPADHAPAAVYVALTEVYGRLPVAVRLVREDGEGEPLAEFPGEVAAASPVETIEAAFNLPPLRFPAAGHYRLQLLVAGTLLVERRIEARVIGGPAG